MKKEVMSGFSWEYEDNEVLRIHGIIISDNGQFKFVIAEDGSDDKIVGYIQRHTTCWHIEESIE